MQVAASLGSGVSVGVKVCLTQAVAYSSSSLLKITFWGGVQIEHMPGNQTTVIRQPLHRHAVTTPLSRGNHPTVTWQSACRHEATSMHFLSPFCVYFLIFIFNFEAATLTAQVGLELALY